MQPVAPAPTVAEQAAACVAIPEHPLVTLAWLAAAGAVAAGLGPLLSRLFVGLRPAFGSLPIGRTDSRR